MLHLLLVMKNNVTFKWIEKVVVGFEGERVEKTKLKREPKKMMIKVFIHKKWMKEKVLFIRNQWKKKFYS